MNGTTVDGSVGGLLPVRSHHGGRVDDGSGNWCLVVGHRGMDGGSISQRSAIRMVRQRSTVRKSVGVGVGQWSDDARLDADCNCGEDDNGELRKRLEGTMFG